PATASPGRPDPATRSSRQAPPSDARTRPRDPASRTTSSAYRSHPRSSPPRAWYGPAPLTTVSAQLAFTFHPATWTTALELAHATRLSDRRSSHALHRLR